MTPAIVTIGNFDGVHRGHQYMLGQVVERAHALGAPSFAVTFFPHPQTIVRPERAPLHLTDVDDKVALIRDLGIDEVWVCSFTRELSELGPEEFLRLVAARKPIRELWVGSDFALGRGRSGSIGVLAEIAVRVGWGFHVVPPLHEDGQVVSSTVIRALLSSGDLDSAGRLLGRPYALRGRVEPTGTSSVYNLRVPLDRVLPQASVYAVRVQQSDFACVAVAAVLPHEPPAPPSHRIVRLGLDASDDLRAGESACVTFVRLIRDLDAVPDATLADGPTPEETAQARAAAAE